MFSIRALIVLATTATLLSCGSQKSSNRNLTNSIESTLGAEYSTEKNSSGNLLLAWKLENNNETPVLKYAIWDLESDEKIYSGSAIRGKVTWIDEINIEVYDYPGIIDEASPLYKYKINLRTKVKTAIHENEKF